MRERFWSDDFDMDLLKVLPDLPDKLGHAADIPLWTYGGTSYGRLNHPSVWNDHAGMVAYFGTDDSGGWRPEGYWSRHNELVACTWLEVLRDAWSHGYIAVVDGFVVWNAQRRQRAFDRLMADLRGYGALPAGEADRLKGGVLASVLAASADLQGVRRLHAKAGA